MISYLQGQLLEAGEENLVINVRGVGYEVNVSDFTRQALSGRESVQLWIYTHVREDIIQLFGFSSKAEKQLFLSLNKVNGIGPKVALKILSGAALDHILSMIENGDVKGLSGLPKVGKKTAEQIILELKGKLHLSSEISPRVTFTARADIVSALVNLGFKSLDVERVVEGMEPSTDFEDGIKRGLSQLAAQF